jgi:uncharacterized repeat protein (TIGR03803 family)
VLTALRYDAAPGLISQAISYDYELVRILDEAEPGQYPGAITITMPQGGKMSKFDWGRRVCIAVLLCATVIALPSQTSTTTFTTLHGFDGTDGGNPVSALVQATDGNLYGTTEFGGANRCYSGRVCGTVFKITPGGTLTTLYSFCSQSNCADGGSPLGALVQAINGDLYGTTERGGANGSGTVFKITPSGTLTTLHSFAGTDGYEPLAGLVQTTDGNLYGTTNSGGANNHGTVFKITPSGTLTTLYSFCSQGSCTDGANPEAGLAQATNGNLYGTTQYGGANGYGTIFKITPNGTLTTLHSFDYTDGAYPLATLVQATDGNFYGTTFYGGSNNWGTVFKMTPSGTLTMLHSFDYTGGAKPYAGLVQATDGNFYGTTSSGGINNDGTVFEIAPSGALTTLYSLCSQSSCTDGSSPYAGLLQATSGKLYGTAGFGGTNNSGTVFSLSVGLAPFVETEPTSGKVGAAVNILGTNLAGATSVTFNGTAAAFKVVSPSLITTTVPAGTTTGKVQVTTPKRTLSSNVPFRVLP